MQYHTDDPRLIIALDYANAADALAFLDHCTPTQCRVKVGHELFTQTGIRLIETIRARGFDIFLDLKYHDIPNTVAASVLRAAELGIWMVNVHCLGGSAMLTAARHAIDSVSGNKPLLIGVTVLTSHTHTTLQQLGLTGSLDDNVERLAKLANATGLDGVVCSAMEAPLLRQACGNDFCLVTPGIRFANAIQDDQQRVVTPQVAIANGADYLVIGRPITQAQQPEHVIQRVIDEIADCV